MILSKRIDLDIEIVIDQPKGYLLSHCKGCLPSYRSHIAPKKSTHITNIKRYGFALVESSERIHLLEYVQKNNPILYIYFITILLSSHRFGAQTIQPNQRGMRSQLLRLLIFHQRCEPLLELLNSHFLAVPMLHGPINRLGWDEHIIHKVNDAV